MIAMTSRGLSALADTIKMRRRELRITQEQLASAAGIPKGTIGSIEAGNIKGVPTLPTLNALEKGLRFPSGYLVGLVNNQEIPDPIKAASQVLGGLTYEDIVASGYPPIPAEEQRKAHDDARLAELTQLAQQLDAEEFGALRRILLTMLRARSKGTPSQE